MTCRNFRHAAFSRRPLLANALAIVVLSLLLPSEAQSQSTLLPTRRLLAPHGLERAWWNQAVLNPARDKVRYLTNDEDVVFIQATSGVVTAFDAETGKRLWSRQLARPDQASYEIVSNDKLALVVVGMQMFGVDKWNGDVIWELKLPSHPSTSPGMDANNVYLGALDGSVYAFSLRKIRELYEEHRLPQWSYEALVWRYKTAKEVTSPPISDGRLVNFASRDGSLYSVSATERNLQFQYETDASVSAPLVESNGLIYLASEDFNFYCLNGKNGTTRWEFVSGLPIRTRPLVVGSEVFLLPARGGMHCLTAAEGYRKWWLPKATQILSVSPDLVYTGDDLGNIVIVDRTDGAPIGLLPLRDFKVRLANERTDRVYIATEGGLVVCIREAGRQFAIYQKYPDRRPILPFFAPDDPTSEPADPTDPAGGAGNPLFNNN